MGEEGCGGKLRSESARGEGRAWETQDDAEMADKDGTSNIHFNHATLGCHLTAATKMKGFRPVSDKSF